jgi:hypothetical protein
LPGEQLHSRYNPQAEAVRYIDSLNLKSGIECFILIEPGLGYIIPVLREKFKNSKIIALHAESGFPPMPEGVPALNGANETSVQDFLEREVPEIDASMIRVIEWRPSLDFYKEAYVNLLSQTVEFIKRLDAGKRTSSVFGRRWVKNFFRNLGNIEKVLLYRETQSPVIITGSGPSLEKAIPVIRRMADYSLIIAASSSLMALFHGGISADIVIATDGGPWALRHIYPFFRNKSQTRESAIAANLCAALPSQCANIPRLILNDGSFWQSAVLRGISLPSVIIPQRGTVTASAAELALLLTRGNIYLAGTDLSVGGIRSHARPYAFDHLLEDCACRLAPVYSKTFIRSNMIKEGGGLKIYAAWFKNQLASWPKRIFSLGANHDIFESPPRMENSIKKNTNEVFKTASVNAEPSGFAQTGAACLLEAMRDSRYAKNINAELSPLLFQGRKEARESEIESAIKKIITEVSNGQARL